jgi:membrane fusion protein (multidrug efflux system)
VVLMWVCRAPEYAAGIGIIRLAGQTAILAEAAGDVRAVLVREGERVVAGQGLVALNADEEETLVESLAAKYRREMVESRGGAKDGAASAILDETRVALEPARARLERRTIRASGDGVVYDVGVQVGRTLNSGDRVALLARSGTEFEMVGLMPGRYAPLLHVGQLVRVRLTGYSHAFIDVHLTEVGSCVVGPRQALALLGPDTGDIAMPTQPVIVVYATVPGTSFESDGMRHNYVPGMEGAAQARIANKRLLFSLIPWADAWGWS